jgi:predicted aldo/keto reductase-like oxidoreductase
LAFSAVFKGFLTWQTSAPYYFYPEPIRKIMKNLDRRNFLKSSILGAGAAVLAKPAIAATRRTVSGSEIITRKLGNTGLEIPVLSMGVMRADNPNIVKAAMDAGITLFDTAHGYQRGENEVMLGNLFKDYKRDSIIIQTKVPPGDRRNEPSDKSDSEIRQAFLEKFEISLGRLKTDYVDILLQHGAGNREAVLKEPVMDALLQAKKDGKTRFIGLSTHSSEPDVIRAAIEAGIYDVITVAYNFKQDHRAEISSAMADAAKAGIGFIGMKTMAGGFMDQEKTRPVNAKAALKWALQDPHLTTCIPGFTAFDQLQLDTDIMTDLELTPEELQELEISSEVIGLYCQGCLICTGQCSKGLPIPEIMRSYMYAYGYGEMQKARETLDEYGVQENPCAGCTGCTVKCTKGFPVAERIADISRIKNVPFDFLT